MIIELKEPYGRKAYCFVNREPGKVFPTISFVAFRSYQKYDEDLATNRRGVGLLVTTTKRLMSGPNSEAKYEDRHIEIRFKLIFFDLSFLFKAPFKYFNEWHRPFDNSRSEEVCQNEPIKHNNDNAGTEGKLVANGQPEVNNEAETKYEEPERWYSEYDDIKPGRSLCGELLLAYKRRLIKNYCEKNPEGISEYLKEMFENINLK